MKKLAHNAILNGIKQVLAILFPIIVFPYVTRTIGSYSYGRICFASSIVAYASLIANLGINDYAIREGARLRDKKEELEQFVNEIFTISFMATVTAYVLLALAVVFVPKIREYNILIAIISITLIFTSLGRDWINTIYEDYKYITIRYIVYQIIAIILLFLFVKSKNDLLIYAFISILGIIASNTVNIFYLNKKYGLKIRFANIRKSLIHIKPILVLFGSAVALQIYINSDIILVGFFLGDEAVGYYSAAAKIYGMVKTLFTAFLMVAVPRFSSELSEGKDELVKKQRTSIFNVLILTIMPSVVGLFMLAKNIVLIASGKEYEDSISPLKILSIALLFACIACFFVVDVLTVNRREKIVLLAMTVSAIVNVIGNVILIPLFGINAAAITTVISELIMLIFGVVYSIRYFSYRNVTVFITALIGCVEVFFTCRIAHYISDKILSQILFSVVVSVFLYLIIVYISQRKTFIEILSSVFAKKR